MESLSRSAEVQLFGDSHEVAQMSELQRCTSR
jgi:hypothetical protein